MNILVIEDNEPMRRLIRSLVSDIADEFHECDDGSQALSAYAEGRPDWTFVDLNVGEVDGLAIVRQLKSAFPTARIILLTNEDDEDLREAARKAGASEYVCKENLLAVRQILFAA